MIDCLRTRVRKQQIIPFILSLRMNSSFITSRPGVLRLNLTPLVHFLFATFKLRMDRNVHTERLLPSRQKCTRELTPCALQLFSKVVNVSFFFFSFFAWGGGGGINIDV